MVLSNRSVPKRECLIKYIILARNQSQQDSLLKTNDAFTLDTFNVIKYSNDFSLEKRIGAQL